MENNVTQVESEISANTICNFLRSTTKKFNKGPTIYFYQRNT